MTADSLLGLTAHHDTTADLEAADHGHEAYKATVRRTDETAGHGVALIRYWQLLNDPK